MKTVGKVALVAGCVLIVGIVISGVAIAKLAKDGFKTANENMVTVDFDFDEAISNINVDAVTNDIIVKASDDNKIHVQCIDFEEVEHDAYIDGDTLYVTTEVERGTNNFNFFFNNTPKIYVYLPDTEYADLIINALTADISVGPEFRFNNITIDVTTGDINLTTLDVEDTLEMNVLTGDINLTNIDCVDVVYNGTTGDLDFDNVLAAGNINIDVTTGDIDFVGDAANIYLECTTGDINMVLYSDKEFDVDVVTGDSNIPRDGDGEELGECVVELTTGDIDIEIDD